LATVLAWWFGDSEVNHQIKKLPKNLPVYGTTYSCLSWNLPLSRT